MGAMDIPIEGIGRDENLPIGKYRLTLEYDIPFDNWAYDTRLSMSSNSYATSAILQTWIEQKLSESYEELNKQISDFGKVTGIDIDWKEVTYEGDLLVSGYQVKVPRYVNFDIEITRNSAVLVGLVIAGIVTALLVFFPEPTKAVINKVTKAIGEALGSAVGGAVETAGFPIVLVAGAGLIIFFLVKRNL